MDLESSILNLFSEHSCANCSTTAPETDPLSTSSVESTFIHCFEVPELEDMKQLKKISVIQALQLILKGRRNPISNEVDLGLCHRCGDLFGKILQMYHEFLSLCDKDSYVKGLVNSENSPPGMAMKAIKIQPRTHKTTKLIRLVEVNPEKLPPPKPLRQPKLSCLTEVNQLKTEMQPTMLSASPHLSAVQLQRKFILLTGPLCTPISPTPSPVTVLSTFQINPSTQTADTTMRTRLVNVNLSPSQTLPIVLQTQPPSPPKTGYNILQKVRVRRIDGNTLPLVTAIIPEAAGKTPGRVNVARARKQKLEETITAELEFPYQSPHLIHLDDDCESASIKSGTQDSQPMVIQEVRHAETDEFGWDSFVDGGEIEHNSKRIGGSDNRKKRKKKSWKPKPHGPNQLLRTRPILPSRLSKEDQLLLKTTFYKCDKCENPPQAFGTLKEWVLHHEDVHQENLEYGNVRNLKVLEPFFLRHRPCPRCGKKIRSNNLMLHHIKTIHLGQLKFICHICQKKLGTKQSLKSHLVAFHPEPEDIQQFLCSLCAATFRCKGSLITHEKIHLGLFEKKYGCKLCPAKYQSKRALAEHQFAHSDERPFVCDICSQTFKVQRHLNNHTRYNHGEKIYDKICEFCGKGFRTKNKLGSHLMCVHKLSKEDAKKSAKMKDSVFRVMDNGDRVFIEQNKKPKTCEFCGKTYVRREGLFTHLITVHGKTEEESKEITGLESKRDLIPKNISRKIYKQKL